MDISNTELRDQEKNKDENAKEVEKINERERKIDEQLKQTFPASDPPSYSQPGNTGEEKI